METKVYKSAWKKDVRGRVYREVRGSHGEHMRFEVRHGNGQNFTLRFRKKDETPEDPSKPKKPGFFDKYGNAIEEGAYIGSAAAGVATGNPFLVVAPASYAVRKVLEHRDAQRAAKEAEAQRELDEIREDQIRRAKLGENFARKRNPKRQKQLGDNLIDLARGF